MSYLLVDDYMFGLMYGPQNKSHSAKKKKKKKH